MRIAIVEDEIKLAAVLDAYLIREGYSTERFTDGELALASLVATPPDLVLLDVMLPGIDGMTICRELRRGSSIPIIMLTARVEEIDRLLGLEMGADDYICKPYSPREVVARVRAVLRRVQPEQGSGPAPEFQLDADTATLKIHDQQTTLTLVEIELLKVLSERPGHIYSRPQLMSRIYPDNRVVSDRTIDSHIKKLRQKIRTISADTDYVQSVYGIGYKFEPSPAAESGV